MRFQRQVQSIVSGVTFIALIITLITVHHPKEKTSHLGEQNSTNHTSASVEDRILDRVRLLSEHCRLYSDPFRPEYSVLFEPPKSLGVEVVYLHGQQQEGSQEPRVASVCIPHKVGSYSWGQFARNLSDQNQDSTWASLDWKIRAKKSLRVVVVRHPMSRLLSVYRMIFEDWCDPSKFLAKQWGNTICNEKNFDDATSGNSGLKSVTSGSGPFSAVNFFVSLLDEHRFGNDRYIIKIWEILHPGERLVSPREQLKFTFSEFVNFIVNGTQLLTEVDESEQTAARMPDLLAYNRLSYHWAPYWKECSLCQDLTHPQLILQMETLQTDLEYLLQNLNLPKAEFPLTHTQKGGHSSSSDVAKKYFSTLTKTQVMNLYNMYKLDHQLFGYSAEDFIRYAQ